MRRRIALLVAAALLPLAGPWGTPRALAATNCSGQGTVDFAAPVGFDYTFTPLPTRHPAVRTTLTFAYSNRVAFGLIPWSACGDGIFLSGTAPFSGWCNNASGRGTTSSGHDFMYTLTGPSMIFSGDVTGKLSVTYRLFQGGGTCYDQALTTFDFSGSLTLLP